MSNPDRTILVINNALKHEDNDNQLLRQGLGQDTAFAYQILTAQDDAAGLALWRSQPIDVILLELDSSASGRVNIDPVYGLQALQAGMGNPCPPIVVVGDDTADMAVQAFRNGAIDYLIRDRMTAADLSLAIRTAMTRLETGDVAPCNPIVDCEHLELKLSQAARALETSQQRYRDLAEAMPQMVWLATAKGAVEYWNQRWYEYTGLSAADSMGIAGVSTVHPDERDRTLAKWSQSIAQGEPFEIEYRIRRRDGVYHWFICRALPTRNSQGTITQWIGTITDIDNQKQLETKLLNEIADHKQTEQELRATNQKVSRILESMTDAYVALDRDWRITYVNQSTAQLNQASPEDLIGRSHWDVWADAKGSICEERYCWAIAHQTPVHFDYFYESRQRWYEVHAYPSPEGLGIYYRDIHDRKQTETLLRDSQAQLQQQLAEIEAIYQTAPIGLTVLDTDLRFVRINQQLADINGLPVEAHIGQRIEDLLPDLADAAEQLLRPILETGTPLLNVEIHGETPAQPGVKRTWLEHFLPLKHGDQVIGISTVCEEITDRMQIEAALRQSEERFRNMADHAPVMIWVTDATGYCTYLSKSWYNFTGQTPETGLGLGWLDAVHPDDYESSKQLFLQANQRHEPFRLEYRLRGQDGNYYWAIDAASPWFGEGNEFQGYIGSVIDISDRKQVEQELRESEARFRTLADNISQFAWMADENGSLFWYNQRWFDYTGTTLEQMQGWGWQHVHHPDHIERVVNKYRHCVETGETWEDTFPLRGQDGQYRWFLSRAIPVRDDQGKVRQWFGTNTDITDLRRTEVALQQATERLNIALKSAPLTLFNQDLDLRYTWVHNPTQNFSVSDVVGQRDEDLVSPETAAHLARLKRQVIDTGEGIREEVKVTKDDQVTYYDLTVDPIRDSHDRVIGITCAAIDISERARLEAERQQAEAALDQSEERYRTLFESIDEGFCVIEMLFDENNIANDYRFLETNPAFEHQTGLSAPQGKKVTELVSNHESYWYEIYGEIALTGEPNRFQNWSEALQRWYDVYAFRIGLPESRKVAVLFSDITDRKRIEAQREQLLQREQTARADAERANRIKDEFLAVLSHELRSPLNPILGWVKLLQTRKLDAAKTAEALTTIERNAKLQTQLIDDLLDVAKILRGKLSLDITSVNLSFVIEAAIDTVKTAAVAKSITLRPVLLDIGQVYGDAARLQQVIWNLLSNAIKFTPVGGKVDVRLETVTDDSYTGLGHSSYPHSHLSDSNPHLSSPLPHQAQITISDTGKGINPEFLPHLFESFRQEDASITRKYGGLGLGLAIVRQLVEAHGGTITASSAGEGRGATFVVRLPLLAVESEMQQPQEVLQPDLDLVGIRVLAVDDDDDARELLNVLLTQYGAEVLIVDSAAKVLANLTAFQPDILISDIGMPEVDGYSLIQQVRALPPEAGGNLLAIALTAYARDDDQQRAIRCGYQRHVTKPLEPDQLVATIIDLIGR